MMKKILPLIMIGFLVLGGLGAAAVTSGGTLSSQDQLENKALENMDTLVSPDMIVHIEEIYGTLEDPQFPDMVIHVEEIYGTLEDPQYRPLPDVTIGMADSVIGIIWHFFWSGTTDESGTTEEIMVFNSIIYKVTVSKDGYHTYKCSSTKIVRTSDLERYDVYFTMAKDGSPFTQHIDVYAQSQSSSSQQSLTSISNYQTS